MKQRMTATERKHWRKLCEGGNNSAAVWKKDDEKFCEDLERRGFVTCYDSMFGNDYYSLTKAGEREIYR